jgi:hypothetical protein
MKADRYVERNGHVEDERVVEDEHVEGERLVDVADHLSRLDDESQSIF